MASANKYRKQFALIFMDDPPSAEIFKEHELNDFQSLPLENGKQRTVKRGQETFTGVVIRFGKRKDLITLNITKDGVVHELKLPGTEYVGTRKHELALIAKTQKKARENNLRELSDQLLNEDSNTEQGGTYSSISPPVKRGPKQRPQEDMTWLKSQIEALPCFFQTTGSAALAGTSKIYLNAMTLHFINKNYADRPAEMFRELLRRLIPENLLKAEGLSFSGKRGTVGIPRNMLEAIEAHVSLHSKGEPFVTAEVVKNLLYYKAVGKKPRLAVPVPQGVTTPDIIATSSAYMPPVLPFPPVETFAGQINPQDVPPLLFDLNSHRVIPAVSSAV